MSSLPSSHVEDPEVRVYGKPGLADRWLPKSRYQVPSVFWLVGRAPK
jgi:hypothetical protein